MARMAAWLPENWSLARKRALYLVRGDFSFLRLRHELKLSRARALDTCTLYIDIDIVISVFEKSSCTYPRKQNYRMSGGFSDLTIVAGLQFYLSIIIARNVFP